MGHHRLDRTVVVPAHGRLAAAHPTDVAGGHGRRAPRACDDAATTAVRPLGCADAVDP